MNFDSFWIHYSPGSFAHSFKKVTKVKSKMIIILYILFVRTKEQTLWSRLEDFHNLTPYLKALYFVQSLVTTYSQGLLLYSFLNNSNLFATGTKVATVGEGSNKKIAKENSRKKWRWALLIEELDQRRINFIHYGTGHYNIPYYRDLTGRQCHTYHQGAGYQRFGDRPTFTCRMTFWTRNYLEWSNQT